MLNFTTQNNGVRGEKIGHETPGYPLMCPKAALLWRVLNLRANGAAPYKPLACVMAPTGLWNNITLAMISNNLKAVIIFYVPNLGL